MYSVYILTKQLTNTNTQVDYSIVYHDWLLTNEDRYFIDTQNARHFSSIYKYILHSTGDWGRSIIHRYIFSSRAYIRVNTVYVPVDISSPLT